MKKSLPILLTLLLLSGCQSGAGIDMNQVTEKEKGAVESLLWLQSADATKDAQQGLERGDKRLLAMATRGGHLPGIEPAMASKAKSICGVRYLPGSTDTVLGKTHLQLLQAAESYAADYNRIMIDHCLQE